MTRFHLTNFCFYSVSQANEVQFFSDLLFPIPHSPSSLLPTSYSQNKGVLYLTRLGNAIYLYFYILLTTIHFFAWI